MQTSPADVQAAVKKTLTSAAFGKFMSQAVQAAVAELEAQPSAVVLQRMPTTRVRVREIGGYRTYEATSADGSREISMQCSRANTPDAHKPGFWYGNESITDANGITWTRQLGHHVQDDFGNLVPVAS